MVFLRNCWYVAAWADEVGENILARTILNEKIAFFRAENGEIAATGDLCPHRFAPLHLGKVVDGTIECPYHGLRFDRTGRCVYNPDGDGRLPAGARVKTYPVTESHG